MAAIQYPGHLVAKTRSFSRRCRRGASLVEFAIVLPILIMTVVFIVEVGRAMLLQHSADTAAYEGARAGIIVNATPEKVIATAATILDAHQITDYTIEVWPDTIDESTPMVSVSVTIPVRTNTWLSLSQVLDFDLSSSVALTCERPPVIQLTGVPMLKNNVLNKTLKNVVGVVN